MDHDKWLAAVPAAMTNPFGHQFHAFKVQYSSGTVPHSSQHTADSMNRLTALLLAGLLLCGAVRAAFEDFVVRADTEQVILARTAA